MLSFRSVFLKIHVNLRKKYFRKSGKFDLRCILVALFDIVLFGMFFLPLWEIVL